MTTHQSAPSAEQALQAVEALIAGALKRGLLEPLDAGAARNAVLDLLGFDAPLPGTEEQPVWRQALLEPPAWTSGDPAALPSPVGESMPELLAPLLDYAAAAGIVPDRTVTQRDLLDARIMGLLLPRPSETQARFALTAARSGVQAATDWFYRLNVDSNYIRMDRVELNRSWAHKTEYGELEITVNLSKPEKDPAEIALLKTLPPSSYPKCLLCKENMGYAGRADHPARQNHRILPLGLSGEAWFLQYSPYVYYKEHCIVFRAEHVPMAISEESFGRLLDFVRQLPHYFVGSNADLPIVGGSILSHDHFQGGRHAFPMQAAPIEAGFRHPGYEDLRFGIVRWPMSVLRVSGRDPDRLRQAAGELLAAWRGYSDPEAEVLAFSAEGAEPVPHNTITPVARRGADGSYELDLVLRNNRTSDEHPEGIFHPHRELHHLKKENIGLIEVMGLAVLPGRLKQEMELLASCLDGSATWEQALADGPPTMAQHRGWLEELRASAGDRALDGGEALRLVEASAGDKFLQVLQDAGVYKQSAFGRAAFGRFLAFAGLVPAT
ncbi:UDP-glucose--hexose-1-phosphate uridylyltransferase [Paenibacillus albicereus]|uniref:Galactose-1-phosphate uridylyltransferase n=1 Tax=Paenibacillus albicereus TaxID=2726185 RepID=A0A6H2H151_9BACL|nr:UDP-glucose--hexose-1-phosphate uridylyltransferase [Paenibacillus albicereus]QJC53382.1 UDP-glucose--hexose-1-phosphate uridylyltransferase [Paenibacillus albicereus]